jgi:uncharacterized protein YraI
MFARHISPRARWMPLFILVLLAATGCNLGSGPGGGEPAISGIPVVRIVSPLANATYLEGVNVNIQALITNAGADIDRIEISVDDSIVQTLSAPNTTGAPSFSVTHSWTAEAVGAHTIGVVAFRADGSSSEPSSVSVSVIAQAVNASPTPRATVSSGGQATQSGGGSSQATATTQDAATTQEPTAVPATATPNVPTATTRQGINVRSGPGTNFNPPIGSLAAGVASEILGRNPAGDWYKIRYYNGQGWVFSGLVDVTGDTSNIPVDAGPPTPLPPTPVPIVPTTVPATAPPATSANLVAGNVRLDPATPTCGQTFNIFFDVANLGSQATASSGSIDVRNVRVADNSPQGSTTGGFPVIQAGQTVNIGPIPLTVSTFYGEAHKVILTINPNGAVPETGNADNTRDITYTLQKGSCP